jgi:nucleoid-associated protein YgaU
MIKNIFLTVLSVALIASVAGCIKTYTFTQKRTDQELSGNRGFIKAPEYTREKNKNPKERTVIGFDVEMPFSGDIFRRTLEEEGDTEEAAGNMGYLSYKDVPEEKEAFTPVIKSRELEEGVALGYARPVRLKADPVQKGSFDYYIVRKGDTLPKISKKVYGDFDKWEIIYEANRDQIAYDPEDIYPGQALKIPRLK